MTKKGKTGLWLLGAVAALAIFLYAILPAIVLHKLNRKLASLDEYQGHVEGVTLHLFHAGLGLKKLVLIVRGSKAPVPLVAVEDIDVHYSWKALVHGGFVGDAVINHPVIHYVMPTKGAPQAGPQPAPQAVKQAAKASAQKAQQQGYAYLNHVRLHDGRLEIEEDDVKPGYVIYLKDLEGVAENIGSKPGLTKQTTTASVTGTVMEKGALKANLEQDALAQKPTFQYAMTMKDVAVPQFNDWLRKELSIEAHGGVLDFDSEAKCVDGRIKGYVKPLIIGLKTVKVKGGSSIGKQIKGEAEKLATEAFKNRKKNQIGTQVPFSGDLSKPKAKVFPALVDLVRNAFFKALSPGLRGLVDFKNFGGGKKG